MGTGCGAGLDRLAILNWASRMYLVKFVRNVVPAHDPKMKLDGGATTARTLKGCVHSSRFEPLRHNRKSVPLYPDHAAFPSLILLFLASFIITLPMNAATPDPPTSTRMAGRATAYSRGGNKARRGEVGVRKGYDDNRETQSKELISLASTLPPVRLC